MLFMKHDGANTISKVPFVQWFTRYPANKDLGGLLFV